MRLFETKISLFKIYLMKIFNLLQQVSVTNSVAKVVANGTANNRPKVGRQLAKSWLTVDQQCYQQCSQRLILGFRLFKSGTFNLHPLWDLEDFSMTTLGVPVSMFFPKKIFFSAKLSI